jgi:hypothetical protein
MVLHVMSARIGFEGSRKTISDGDSILMKPSEVGDKPENFIHGSRIAITVPTGK